MIGQAVRDELMPLTLRRFTDRFRRAGGVTPYRYVLEDRPLREHGLKRVHLMGVLERVPHAHVRDEPALAIDAHVIVHEPGELRQWLAQRSLALAQQPLRFRGVLGIELALRDPDD